MLPMNVFMDFEILPPYDKAIRSNKKYRIVDRRLLSNMIKVVPNVYEFIYRKLDRTKDEFMSDKEGGIYILTLEDRNDRMFEIPENKINTLNIETMVEVVDKTIGISLGTVPVDIDLDGLDRELVAYILNRLGIPTVIEIIETSDRDTISITDLAEFEDNRLKEKLATNIYDMYESVAKENIRLQDIIRKLVEYNNKKIGL